MSKESYSKAEVQFLVDAVFKCAVLSAPASRREEVAAGVAEQLRGIGFDTEMRGMSWGILK